MPSRPQSAPAPLQEHEPARSPAPAVVIALPAASVPPPFPAALVPRSASAQALVDAVAAHLAGGHAVPAAELLGLSAPLEAISGLPPDVVLRVRNEPGDSARLYDLVGCELPRGVRVVIPPSDECMGDIRVATALGFPVELAPPFDAYGEELLAEVADYYLHHRLLRVPVEPLHTLFMHMVGRPKGTLWQLYHEAPHRFAWVDEAGRASASERWATAGRYYDGSEPGAWSASDLAQELLSLQQRLFDEASPCTTCPAFPTCGGFLTAVGRGECTAWRATVERLDDESRELRAAVREARTQQPPPRNKLATLFVSYRCNHDCVFCATSEARRAGHQDDLDAMLRFVDDAAARGVKRLTLSGAGEPTLSPHLSDVVGRARERGIRRVTLFTNGHGLDEVLLDELVRRGLTYVLVSLHGTREVHDGVARAKGAHERALRAIALLAAKGTPFTINTCLTRPLLPVLDTFVAETADLGATVRNLSFPFWAGTALAESAHLPTYSEVASALAALDFSRWPTLQLENVPHCVGGRGAPVRPLEGTVLYHEARADGSTDGAMNNRRNVYPDVCDRIGCKLRGACIGIDATYLRHRGDAEVSALLPGLVERMRDPDGEVAE